jgi:putative hydrolase of the HAD superfamily
MNVVFDFGGVLFDWQPRRLVREVLPRHAPDDASATRLVERFFEGFDGDWAAFDRGHTEPGPLAERIAQRVGLAVEEAAAVIDAVPRALRPVPSMEDLVERLVDAGHAVYFLSNMPQPYAAYLERRHAVVGRFRDGVFSGRVGLIKPDPAIYALAAQRFGIVGEPAVFIDDLRRNVDAAAQAQGWRPLHFASADACERELAALGLLAA